MENKDTEKTEETEEVKEIKETEIEVGGEAVQEPPKKSGVASTVLLIILAILTAIMATFVILDNFVYKKFLVEGESMQSTLLDGDVVLGKRHKAPSRGDIVVIEREDSSNKDKLLIKRVIGMGGDTVKIEGGYVYLKKRYEEDFTKLDEKYLNEENYGKTYYPTSTKGTSAHEWVLNDNEIFYLGDNRNNSTDSRYIGYDKCYTDQIVSVIEPWSFSFIGFNKAIYNLFR